MILGMSVHAFTQLHTIISLVGIGAGLVFLGALLGGRWLSFWNQLFLWATILTSVTGFFFPITKVGPPHIVGAISMVVLAVSLVALYAFRRTGAWGGVYVGTAVLALYLNAFVGVVQTFQKIGPFNALAPTQTEPPFLVAQALVLGAFAVAGFVAVRGTRRVAAAVA